MVSSQDLQIWQQAVNGINDSGKADLTQEEWSALSVLNNSLSNGNFRSEESRYSINAIKENLSIHRNNPILQTHLQIFIDLCVKYGAKLQSSEVTPPASESTTTQVPTEVTNTQKLQAETTAAPSPVTPDDLQNWQQILSRIEAAQNDLLPNELSAFNALVSLFNSGNFGANESGGYIQIIKNSTTKNRLLKRIYLPTFVALCEKYFMTQATTPTPANTPSTSSNIMRQTNTSSTTKKSGSNSLLIIIIVAIILGVGYYMVKDSDWFNEFLGQEVIVKTDQDTKHEEIIDTKYPDIERLEKQVAEQQQKINSMENEIESLQKTQTTQQEVQSPTPPSYSTNSTIPGRFPQASERLLSDSDLRYLSKEDLKIMRNEIFARHGFIFQTDAMKTYFRNQSWYSPRYSNVNSWLTNIEQKNIALIQSYEKQ